MKETLDLKLPGVMELGMEELKKVDGGWVWPVVKWVLLGIAWETINNPKEAAESFKEGLLAK